MKRPIHSLWILGPGEYKHSGVYNYSTTYIDELDQYPDIIIQKFNLCYNSKSIYRYFRQYIYLPIYLLLNSNKFYSIILYEESLAFLFPFIRTKRIIIVHDVRTVNKNQNLGFIEYWYFKKNQFLHTFLSKFDHIIAVSKFTQKNLLNLKVSKDKVSLIYNSFNLKEFNKIPVDKKSFYTQFKIILNPKKIYLLYVGTEETRKNFITILKLLKKYPNKYSLIKIGKAIVPENKKFHLEYVSENGLDVYFFENISHENLISFYSSSDVFINTSTYEGFGRTPIEAQSCGLPVVSTDKGALKEVLGKSAIIIKNPTDIGEIDKGISHALSSQDLVKGGLENCKRFDVNGEKKKWIKTIVG